MEGDFIGTDIGGTVALGNAGVGVQILAGATENTIGGTITGAANLISGNTGDGIEIDGSGTSQNVVGTTSSETMRVVWPWAICPWV